MLLLLALVFVVVVVAATFGGRRHGHGVNDLGRWKQFGGTLERPAPPAPLKHR